MSMFLTKLSKLFTGLKQMLQEELWLFCILVLLLALGMLGVMRLTKLNHHPAPVFSEAPHYLVSQVQISPSELSRIVSLPLTDLLNIDLYIEAGSSLLRGDPVMMTSLSGDEVFSVLTQELMLSNRSRRARADVLICNLNCNTKNNEAIVELT